MFVGGCWGDLLESPRGKACGGVMWFVAAGRYIRIMAVPVVCSLSAGPWLTMGRETGFEVRELVLPAPVVSPVS